MVNIRALLEAKKIVFDESVSRHPKDNVECRWFHFNCTLRPGHNDAKNWICVHPTDGISGGCHHGKCHGKGFPDILAVIAPELAAQAAETFDDSYRLARGYVQSRSPLAFWQGIPHGYRNGSYVKEDEASIRAEISLYAKKEFDSLGFEKTPNVTLGLVYNVQAAAAALNFDRAEETPHWRTEEKHGASEYLAFKNGLLHVPTFLAGGDALTPLTPDYFSLGLLPYNFDPKAPIPFNYMAYCQNEWADFRHHLLLEEITGDILLADPRTRVFYAFTGKGGAGKSSVVETIESAVGEQNRCAVDLIDFAEGFGLQEAVGKKLILCAEANVDRRHANGIVEKIKRVTGNDCVNVKCEIQGGVVGSVQLQDTCC